MEHNLWIVIRFHSVCKLCYCVHTNDRNLRPYSSNYILQHNVWMLTWIHSGCKLYYNVHTYDHNLGPMFFLTMLMPCNTIFGWLGFIQDVSCANYVHTYEGNLKPMFFPTMPGNAICGLWFGFAQPVSFTSYRITGNLAVWRSILQPPN